MPRAERDLACIFDWIGAESSEAALQWYGGLREAVRSLQSAPGRCPVTPEGRTLRNLLYGNKAHVYRVIFRIIEKQKQVDVLHIRHSARQAFKGGEL